MILIFGKLFMFDDALLFVIIPSNFSVWRWILEEII